MDFDIKVDGLAELEKKLLKLGAEVGEKELHSALMSATLPTFKAAKAAAPEGPTGNLKRSIKRRRMRSKKSRRFTVRGVGAGNRNTAAGVYVLIDHKIAPHAHLVHEGTELRRTKGEGKRIPYKDANRGLTPRNQFLYKAWLKEGGEKAVRIFADRLKKRIKKYER